MERSCGSTTSSWRTSACRKSPAERRDASRLTRHRWYRPREDLAADSRSFPGRANLKGEGGPGGDYSPEVSSATWSSAATIDEEQRTSWIHSRLSLDQRD